MNAIDLSQFPAVFGENDELPTLWSRTRIASGPLKLTLGCTGREKSILSDLLQFIQGVHHSVSGYEFFCPSNHLAYVYKNGDYMGNLRLGYPSANASKAAYIVRSRNVVGKKGRGALTEKETYSGSVEKAVSLANGLFTRPRPGDLMREIRSYMNATLHGVVNLRTASSDVNSYAEKFYTSLRTNYHSTLRVDPALMHLQGKTMLLCNVALLVQGYRQQQGDVPWDTHDESLDMDSLILSMNNALTALPGWDMNEFLRHIEMYREGVQLQQRIEKQGMFVLINTIGDIHCIDIAGMNFPIGSPPPVEKQAAAYQFYRKGMECVTFPKKLHDAMHTLYSIGEFQYVKDVGVLMTCPKLPAYDQVENFNLGTLFYIESSVLEG